MKRSLLAFLLLLPAWAEVEIPPPDVAEMKGPVAHWIEQLHTALAESSETDPLELARQHGDLGNLYHGMKRFDNAAIFYANALELDPNNPDWAYYLGLLERDRNHHDAAAKWFREALARNDKDVHAMVRLGNVLLQVGRAEEAEQVLRRAELLAPGEAMIAFGLARCADAASDWRGAVNYYQRALDLQPQADYIHYPLGMAWRRLGDRDKAVHFLSRRGETEITFADPRVDYLSSMVTRATLQVVLAMAGDKATTTRDLVGFVNTNLGGRPGLREYFADAAENMGATGEDAFTVARLHYLAGLLLRERGEWDWAAGHFQLAMSLYPLPEALVERGNIWARKGKIELALEHFDKALQLDERNNEALFARANALMALDRPEDAVMVLEKLLLLEPENKVSRQLMARAQAMLGNEKGEIAQLEALLEHAEGEEAARAHLSLARLYQESGDAAQVLQHTRKAAELMPDSDEAQLALASSLAFAGRIDEALSHFDALVKRLPDRIEVHLGRYAALVLSGRYGQALQALESASQQVEAKLPVTHLMARLLAAVPNPELRDGSRALTLARSAFDEIHNLPHAETLAMALAATGAFDEAGSLQRRLLDEARANGFSQAVLDRLNQNLARYEAGQACCAPLEATALFLPN